MSQHSLTETQNQLSELIERAEKGEEIVITRDDKPVARLSAIAPKAEPKRITQEDIDWLDKHRIKGKMPKEDAGTFVSRMRDEEWQR